MSSNSTVYDISVKYRMDDKATGGIKGLASATDKAASSAWSLKGALAAAGGMAALHFGKELLVDFNQEMDDLKISMTTVMQMNMHMPFEKASAAADKLFFTFQDMAKVSPAMTKDFMEMASAIAPAVSAAGGDIGKLEKMTQGAIGAGIAFHVRPDQMSMDIQEMLAGNVRLSSRTANQMIRSQGLDHKEFNALSGKDRAKMTEKILGDPAIMKALERSSHTMAGEMSTVKDNLQIALGEVGRPMMVAMTEEVRKWNTWIENHPKLIKEYVTSFANMIKDAFSFVKSVGGWLVDNRELLFSIAKAFLLFKGAQMGSNMVKTFAEGISKMGSSLMDGANTIKGMFSTGGGFVSVLGAMPGAIGAAVQGLSLFVGALEIASALLNTHSAQDKKNRENAISLNEATGDIPGLLERNKDIRKNWKGASADAKEKMQTELFANNAKLGPEGMGLALRKINEVSEKNGGASLKDMSNDVNGLLSRTLLAQLPDTYSHDSVTENTKIMRQVDATLTHFQNMTAADRLEALKVAFPDQYGMPTPAEDKSPGKDWSGGNGDTKVSVTINKVEVASEDPDRFVFGLVQIADQAVKHRTQSKHAMSGGL